MQAQHKAAEAQGATRKADSRKLVRTRHPGIYKRGSSYVVVWAHKGKTHKKVRPTLAAALEFQGEMRQQGNARAPVTREMFRDYWPDWLASYRGRTKRGVGVLTLADYERSGRLYHLPEFGHMRLADIEPPDVRRLVAKLERDGKKPNSIRSIMAPLKAMFATAIEDGTIRGANPAAVRIMGRTDDGEAESRALTNAELARFFAEIPDEWRLFFDFLTQTGLRISECLGLTWDRIDFGKRRVRVREQLCRGDRRRLKSEYSGRDIPLTPTMARRLWAIGATASPDAPVFASKTGTPLDDQNVRNRVLTPARKAAGFDWDGFGFHTFRHTCASHLFAAGKNVQQVSEWLGHANAAFTQRVYIHLIDGGIGDAPESFDTLGQLPAEADCGANDGANEAPQTPANDPVPLVAESA